MSSEHTFERRLGSEVVVFCTDFAIACGRVERGGLATKWGLSDHLAVGCLVADDDLEEETSYRDAVDWLRVQITVADEEETWYRYLVGTWLMRN